MWSPLVSSLRAQLAHHMQRLSCLCSRPPRPRPFSHRSSRLVLVSSATVPRPQLPFLYPSALRRGRLQGARFLTYNQKKYLKETAHWSVKFSVGLYLLHELWCAVDMVFLYKRQERFVPAPAEWGEWTKFRYRRGRWWEEPENNQDHGFPNWARLYAEYDHALKRLENPRKDGAGLVELGDDSPKVPGRDRPGFDLTAKSGEWREGYYELLMGMGRAAERMEGWVSNRWKWKVWSPEFVLSESNPRPRHPPPGMPLPPRPEKRHFVTAPPETFYMRILFSTGFTTAQRVSAAVAYGDWLSFKKKPNAAEFMYKTGLIEAIRGLPTSDTSSVISSTGVLQPTAAKETVTPNLIHAATTLATHYAASGRAAEALPIYLSVLRARRNADPGPPLPRFVPKDSSVTSTLINFFETPPAYPPLAPTGNEPLLRRQEERCEEASLMTYIAEILFATAASDGQRRQALLWAREAVSTAEAAHVDPSARTDVARQRKCHECVEVGLENWGKMMTYLEAEARTKRAAVEGHWLWRWWDGGRSEQQAKAFIEEENVVAMRLTELRSRMLEAHWDEMDRRYARTFVV